MPELVSANKRTGVTRNQVLFVLFCAYVFFAPFEDLLEYLYGIKTIFKPYRLFGILILLFGFFYDFKRKPFFVFKPDILVVLFQGYGVFYTFLLFNLGFHISFGSFLNSQIQMTFLTLIFLTFKRLDLTYKQINRILAFMCAGIIINGLIILVDFYILQISSREKGLSDNPNYAAYGMAIATVFLTYLLMKNRFSLLKLKNLFYFGLVGVMFFTILATGSRGGFILFAFCMFLMTIVLSDTQTKVRLIPIFGAVLLVVLFNTNFQALTEETTTFNRLQGATQDIRVPLAKAGFAAFVDTYGMGLGVSQMLDRGTFAYYIGPVDRNLVYAIEVRDKGLSLHNMYIEVAVETGVIGIGLWTYFLFLTAKFQWDKFRLNDKNRPFHRMLFVCIVGLLLFAMTGKGLLGALFWFVITVCSKEYYDEEDLYPDQEIISE
ncbi:MAG: O-antigen ligase family protein [Saprospiraceae bacterium]|nr:O-antigen ligase family protein [Saprospiraceae bacterium]